ncbi:MAG TPA: altronate dehydratase family protein [Tepidisphaeraceae bacterium]|jgi:altronate hydrolase
MTHSTPRALDDCAVVVHPDLDDVAVAREPLPAGTSLASDRFGPITLTADIPAGHRFALRPVPAGAWIHQYGQPFALSRGLLPGDPVNADTADNQVPHVDAESLELQTPGLPPWQGPRPTFMGYRRPDGRVGVRNWVLVVPTSMCSSHEAATIALQAELTGVYSRDKYPNVDGVTAIPHTRGCGCPDYEPTARTPDQLMGVVEASMRMLGRYIEHPNVGAVLVIELGCEKTNLDAVGKYVTLAQQGTTASRARGASLIDFGQRHGKPVLTLSVQSSGGTLGTIKRGLELLPQLLDAANDSARTECDAGELVVGLKCGGSDAFSGLSANPALGVASDLLVRAGGTTIITEIPEFFGAEHLFAARARDRDVARQVFQAMERFRKYVARVGGSMAENPSPGNKEGGLLNITIKSLGALAKSGTAPVEGVLDYAQSVWDHHPSSILHPPSSSSAPRKTGLHLLYCPSYDQESTPALVASGCQIVCFTTGRGTGIGNAIAPVIKIASNANLHRRMPGDIDLSAAPILDDHVPVQTVGQQLFDLILATASGQPVKAEQNGHREFMIWSEEAVSL